MGLLHAEPRPDDTRAYASAGVLSIVTGAKLNPKVANSVWQYDILRYFRYTRAKRLGEPIEELENSEAFPETLLLTPPATLRNALLGQAQFHSCPG